MRKVKVKNCLHCEKEFEYIDGRQKFCNSSCSTIYNNTGRRLTNEQKLNISKSLKKYYKENPDKILKGNKLSEAVGKGTKGRFRKEKPKSILELSSRTVGKILKRLNIGCSRCGWDKGRCDIHHINGRTVSDADGHWNLTYICPNCHREYHSGNTDLKKEFIPLSKYVKEEWREVYYG